MSLGVFTVAAATVADGGDNIAVYVLVFAATPARELAGYVIVFLVLVGLWCAAGRFVATDPLSQPCWQH